MSVPRGVTATFTLTIDDETIDLTQAANVYVTFSRRGKTITKSGDDLTVGAQTIMVGLTQAESLAFPEGAAEVQANWTYANGSRCATDVAAIDFSRQLLERVVL